VSLWVFRFIRTGQSIKKIWIKALESSTHDGIRVCTQWYTTYDLWRYPHLQVKRAQQTHSCTILMPRKRISLAFDRIGKHLNFVFESRDYVLNRKPNHRRFHLCERFIAYIVRAYFYVTSTQPFVWHLNHGYHGFISWLIKYKRVDSILIATHVNSIHYHLWTHSKNRKRGVSEGPVPHSSKSS